MSRAHLWHGTRLWIVRGERHRVDGPAFEAPDGTKAWWLWGKLHREGGPAIEWANGFREWYEHGRRVRYEELP